MVQSTLFYFCIFILFTPFLEASAIQGKDTYKKECLQCHLEGKSFATKNTAKGWQALFKTGALSQLHVNNKAAKASWSYFEGESYQKDIKHLKDFLQKYSSDRGKHNSCN